MIEISLIVATYNAANTLDECLQSICSQLTEECELIIIDGKSSDHTLDIIKTYAHQIAYYVSEPDKGIYDAWNKGIAVARGNWIGFIGADDILLPHALTTYLSFIHSTLEIDAYDYICAHNEYIDKNGRFLKIIGREPKWGKMRRAMMPAHVASLHNRKNLFGVVGPFNICFRICADYELLLRKRADLKYYFLDVCIARMKVGGMSFSTKAIFETYEIRKQLKTISQPMNFLLLIKDWLLFKCFVLRYKCDN